MTEKDRVSVSERVSESVTVTLTWRQTVCIRDRVRERQSDRETVCVRETE